MPTKSATPAQHSGYFDYHCHLDRAGTFHEEFFEHEGGMTAFIDAPLKRKQIITGVLHRGPAYSEKSLRQRMSSIIEQKIAAGETGMNAIVDCSVDIGPIAFDTALQLREEYDKKGYVINVGAYPIFGIKEWGSDRQKLIEELAPRAQFLIALPERDDEHSVGFDGHLRFMIDLATTYSLPLQVHVDQTNTPTENGTERLVQAVHWLLTASDVPVEERPEIWAVHMISPSCYSRDRFQRLLTGLKENNIGVIVCPHAALSMRQMHNCDSSIHNSIAKVREVVMAGIPVRFGTDNINDLFMPLPETPLLQREYDVLASAIRFYDKNVLNKFFAGERLNETDRDRIQRSIDGDNEAFGFC